VQIANALMASAAWCTSALFVTWDDFGGFYDHLQPPNTSGQNADSFGPGARVPLLVISPYAKTGYVDPTPYDFSSLVKFAELNFALQPLTARDLYSNNMLNAFNFNHVTSRLTLTQRTCPASAAALKSKPNDDFDDD